MPTTEQADAAYERESEEYRDAFSACERWVTERVASFPTGSILQCDVPAGSRAPMVKQYAFWLFEKDQEDCLLMRKKFEGEAIEWEMDRWADGKEVPWLQS